MLPRIDISQIITRPVKVHFLEMHQPPVEKLPSRMGLRFALQRQPVSIVDYRTLYYGVGEKYFWLDRMVMEDKLLNEKINAPNVDLFVMYADEVPAGFAEFVKEEKYIEILYFGLLPAFIGKGLGRYFLQWVIQQAWSYGKEWIQLNTCTLDHPKALPNYKAAGFIEVRTAVEQRKIYPPELADSVQTLVSS